MAKAQAQALLTGHSAELPGQGEQTELRVDELQSKNGLLVPAHFTGQWSPRRKGPPGGVVGLEEGEVEGTSLSASAASSITGQTSSITGTDSRQPDKDKCHRAGVNREEFICQ